MASLRIALDARLIGRRSTGDSTYWAGLVHGLRSVAGDHEILLLSNAPAPSEIPAIAGMRWICIPSENERWWSWVKMPLAAKRLGVDLVHVQYSVSPLLHNAVTTIHDVSFMVGPEWFKPRDRLLLQRTTPSAIRRAKRVLTVSEASRRDIERYFPSASGKVAVTPLAPGLGIKAMERSQAALLVKELGVEGPFLLAVGTRWPRKNLDLAVRAVDQLPASLPHKLVLTGKSGWGEKATSGRVKEVGYVSDETLSALYSCAELFLMPSHYEGFGIPVLEAFLCGCPVLCSSGGALPEAAGGAAHVEPSWEPSAWSAAIQNLLSDSGKLEQLRKAGYRRVEETSWPKMATLTFDAYLQALGRR